MSLNNVFDEAIEAGAVEEDLFRVEDLRKKILPMGASELTEFVGEYLELIKNADRPMNQKFLQNLFVVLVDKEISLGMCDKNNKKNRIEELKSSVPTANLTKLANNGVIEKDGCYKLLKVSGDDIKMRVISNWIIDQKKVVVCQDGQQKTLLTINRDGYKSTVELTNTSMKSASDFECLLKTYDQIVYFSATPQEFNESFKPFFSSIPFEYIYSEDYLGLHYSSNGEPVFLSPLINKKTRILETEVLSESGDPDDLNRICNTESARKVNYQLRDCSEQQFKFLVQKMLTVYPKINAQEKTVTGLAWFAASLLSAFLKERKSNNFPPTYYGGNGEDGKSEMVRYCSLFIGHNTGVGLALSSSKKPLRLALTGSNAHPAILEEANTNDHRAITILIDYLKSAYDNHELSIGRIKGTDDYNLVNPACVISNYNINEPALRTRMIILEILKSDWEGNPEAIAAYKEMEEIAPELNKASYKLVKFFLSKHREWDSWYNKAVSFTLANSNATGRMEKSLNVIAFGLVMLQELAASLDLKIEFLTDAAINEHMKWLSDYLIKTKSEASLEGEFLRFVARKHQPGKTYDHYLYDPTQKHPVAIDRMYWLDQFMEYLGKGSETRGIARSSVDRATRVKVAKAIIGTSRPRIGSRQPTFCVIDMNVAEKEFSIDKQDWIEDKIGLGLPELPKEP